MTAARDPVARDTLAAGLQPARRALQRAHGHAAARAVLARLTAQAPLLALLLLGVAVALLPVWAVPFWAPPLALLLLGGALTLLAMLLARQRAVRMLDAALACDRAHASKDQLAAAFELAGEEPRQARPLGEALAAAAIEDGVARLRAIDAQRVAAASRQAHPHPGRAVLSLAALTLLLLLLPAFAGGEPQAQSVAQTGQPGGAGAAPKPTAADAGARLRAPAALPNAGKPPGEPRAAAPKRSEPPPPGKPEPTPSVPAASGAGKSGSDEVGDSTQSGTPKAAPSASPGAGRPGGGQGSAAAGAPEPAPEQPRPPARPNKPKPKPPSKPSPDQEQKASESAGSPSGPSRGSGRMSPVGNKRQDLNRGMERDDDPDIEDEPIEDETDEQEQRGGVTPLKRQDQRPAARELTISGDGPPDQGRGGPTPPKKSRGTASLVLGLKLPDQVRGQPNPGTAKTSMEQIPPRRQQAEPGLALPAAQGRLGTPQSLRPVAGPLQALLAAYHALLRQQDQPSPSAQALPEPQNQDR